MSKCIACYFWNQYNFRSALSIWTKSWMTLELHPSHVICCKKKAEYVSLGSEATINLKSILWCTYYRLDPQRQDILLRLQRAGDTDCGWKEKNKHSDLVVQSPGLGTSKSGFEDQTPCIGLMGLSTTLNLSESELAIGWVNIIPTPRIIMGVNEIACGEAAYKL